MILTKKTSFLFAMLLMVGCASAPKPENFVELFLTKITEDGSKSFIYHAKPLNLISTNQDRSRKGKNTAANDIDKEDYLKLIQAYLAEQEYCRDGYVELDADISRKGFVFSGECNETANAQDKQIFINSSRFDEFL